MILINIDFLTLGHVLRLPCGKTLYISVFPCFALTRFVGRMHNFLHLVTAFIGLLQTLDDCGSPPLAARAPTLSRPTSLRTADRKSMMAFMGLPLDVFGKVIFLVNKTLCFTDCSVQDAWFQPYLPLQQIDMLKDTPSWLCGCTNSIITQQSDIDLLVHVRILWFMWRRFIIDCLFRWKLALLNFATRSWKDRQD